MRGAPWLAGPSRDEAWDALCSRLRDYFAAPEPPAATTVQVRLGADGGRVSLIDTRRRAAVSLLAVGLSPYGIAIAPDGGCAYVANSGSDTILILDASVSVRRGAAAPPPPGTVGPLPLPSPAQPQAVLGKEGGTGAGIAAERHRFVPPNPRA